jgi:hypothetical protein
MAENFQSAVNVLVSTFLSIDNLINVPETVINDKIVIDINCVRVNVLYLEYISDIDVFL